MIVTDIETSGLYPEIHGIWQIGALDFYNPLNIFLQEGRIDDEDDISEGALKVIGKTESYLRDKSKQSQRQLIQNFFEWTKPIGMTTAITQNTFDNERISFRARKYGIENPYHHRIYDLHSFASLKYQQINGKFVIKDGHSNMGLLNILEFCGMKDNRKAHNALEDCKLTAECFSRIVYGKSLLNEFLQYKIPEYLKK